MPRRQVRVMIEPHMSVDLPSTKHINLISTLNDFFIPVNSNQSNHGHSITCLAWFRFGTVMTESVWYFKINYMFKSTTAFTILVFNACR